MRLQAFPNALLQLLAAAVALSGCSVWGPEGGPGGKGGPATTTSPPDTGPTQQAAAGSDGIQRITIQAGDDLRFRPSTITAHPGTLQITVHNTGITPHTFTFPTPPPGPTPTDGIPNLNGGQTQTIRLTITQPGHYPFQCAYHATNGMHGTLLIR